MNKDYAELEKKYNEMKKMSKAENLEKNFSYIVF